MSEIKKLANQTVIYGMSSIVGRVINFLLVPLYVSVFKNPAEFSVYVEMYAWFTFLNILYTYGMETTFFRFANNYDKPGKVFNTSFFTLFVSTLAFSIIFFLIRIPVAHALGYEDKQRFLTWIILILAFDTLTVVPFSSLRQSERPIKFAAIKILNILTNVFMNIFFLVLCPFLLKHDNFASLHPFINLVYSPKTGIGYIFISNLIASFVTLLFLFKEIKQFRFDIDYTLIKKMLIYSSPLFVVGMAGMVNDSLDRTILKYLLPYDQLTNERMLGIYGANVRLSVFMVLVIQAYRFAAEPFFYIQSKNINAKQVYSDVMKYFVIAGLLIFLVVTLYLDFFKYFLGAKGSAYHEGLGVVPILLMANLTLGIYYNLSIWYKLQDKTMLGAVIAVIGAALTIILNIVFIPLWGYYASAITKLACYIVMVVLSYFFAQKYYPVAYRLGSAAFYFTIALLIYFSHLVVKMLLPDTNLFISFCIGSFFLLIFVLITFRKEKKTDLLKYFVWKKQS